jgi:beta-galactosidase
MRGRALTLWFDALMQDSQVWINGHLLGRRPYGYVPVIEPIDAWVLFGAENTIAVRLDCTCGGDRWYSGAGMIRSAYVLDEPKMHLQPFGLAVTPQVDAVWSGAQVLSAVRWQNDADQPFEGQLELTLTVRRAIAAPD